MYSKGSRSTGEPASSLHTCGVMYWKYVLVLLVALQCCLAAPITEPEVSDDKKQTLTDSEVSKVIEEIQSRTRRQSELNNSISNESTTRKPTRRRQGLFSLLSELISETRQDAVSAFSNISRLITQNLITPTRPEDIRNNATTSTTEADVEGRTTTEEPYRITQDEFYRILRRNLRGLANLFNKESRQAIKDSNNNARQVRKQLQDVLRPFIQTE